MRISDGSSDVCSSDLLRAEELATAVAIAMGADKLMFVTPPNPVQWGLAEGTGDAGQLSWAEGEHLLDNGSLTPVDRSHLQADLAETTGRSEGSRDGHECASTCSARWLPYD